MHAGRTCISHTGVTTHSPGFCLQLLPWDLPLYLSIEQERDIKHTSRRLLAVAQRKTHVKKKKKKSEVHKFLTAANQIQACLRSLNPGSREYEEIQDMRSSMKADCRDHIALTLRYIQWL